MDALALRDAPLTKLMSVNIRSKEFPNALARMLASQEDMNAAVPLQADDALNLVDILDQVSRSKIIGVLRLIPPTQTFEAPNVEPDLRRKSSRILRRICAANTILPRSYTLSDNISKVGDIAFASGGFADVWKGRHNGNSICVKAFRVYTPKSLSVIKQVRTGQSYT